MQEQPCILRMKAPESGMGHVPGLSMASCVTLGKLLNFSEPQSPLYLQTWNNTKQIKFKEDYIKVLYVWHIIRAQIKGNIVIFACCGPNFSSDILVALCPSEQDAVNHLLNVNEWTNKEKVVCFILSS